MKKSKWPPIVPRIYYYPEDKTKALPQSWRDVLAVAGGFKVAAYARPQAQFRD